MISLADLRKEASQRPSRIPGLAPALPLCAAAFAAALRPPAVVTVSEWAAANRIIAAESGSPFPGKWSNDLAPYLVEVMDCLSLSHPAREVVFKKSAQIGGTEAGLNAIGTIIDQTPAPIIVVLPSLDAGRTYVKTKLQPAIESTPVLRSKVWEQTSRDGSGSTSSHKGFKGGFLMITGANSAKGLKSTSARVLILDEVTEYPFDVDNQGDPVDLALKRVSTWAGREKIFYISTPGIKGMCRVSARYKASDQRRYHVPCPHCSVEQVLEWSQVRFTAKTADEVIPAGVWYACIANGCVIQHHAKAEMLARGRWIAQFPGRQPGFAINQLYSPTVPWSDTVRNFLEAKDAPAKLKVWVQQALGEEWEEKQGEAPDFLKLYARREAYRLGRLPPGVLMVTMGVDVQADRLEYGVWGWGIGKTSWLVDRGVILGDTTLPQTWRPLEEVLQRKYPDELGNTWPIERAAVDAGYNTQAVYAWCRGRSPVVLPVKGMSGHNAPALGAFTHQEVNWRGQKLRRGIKLYPVGTWRLKSEFYANLRKTIEGPDGDGSFPIGYVHLSEEVDENYCKQLTAEVLVEKELRGFKLLEWHKVAERNEALDIRVYADAAAADLGIDRFTRARWAEIAASRGIPQQKIQGDLEALWGAPVRKLVEAAPVAPAPEIKSNVPLPIGSKPPAPARPNFLGVRPGGYWRR